MDKTQHSDADDSLSYLIYQLGGIWRRHLNERLGELGLSQSQLMFLSGVASLAQQGRSVRQRDLSQYHQASRALTSEVVRLLERNGFVRQVPMANDGRAKSLKLTPFGDECLKRAMKVLAKTEETFLADREQLKGRLKRDLQAALEYELTTNSRKRYWQG